MNRGPGSEPEQGLHSWWEHTARAAGQAEGGELALGLVEACPRGEGLGSQDLRGRQGEEEVRSACSGGGGLDPALIELPV